MFFDACSQPGGEWSYGEHTEPEMEAQDLVWIAQPRGLVRAGLALGEQDEVGVEERMPER